MDPIDTKNPGTVNVAAQPLDLPTAADASAILPPGAFSDPVLAQDESIGAIIGQGVLANVIPDVDVADQSTSPVNADVFTVTDEGSFSSNPSQSIVTYTIVSVVDSDTGGAPGASTVNLLITVAGLASLLSYGIDLAGRLLSFLSGAWIPASTVPQRPILTAGGLTLLVPNKDAAGTPFAWPSGPAAGNVVSLDVARTTSENVYKVVPASINVIPETFPVL
jgi:hypothetical protein